MQSNDYFRTKARRFAKQTWAGPGRFGVFILLCLVVVATFESLGLSNRERNLELRNVQSVVMPIELTPDKMSFDATENVNHIKIENFQEKLKQSAQIDFEKKNLERENILIYGTVDQYLFEHQNYIQNYDGLNSLQEKQKFFLSLILGHAEEIIKLNEEDVFVLDI